MKHGPGDEDDDDDIDADPWPDCDDCIADWV